MIDFAKLARQPIKTAEERQAEEAARIVADIAADRAKRAEYAKKNLKVVLTYDVETRFTMTGATIISIHGKDDAGRPVRAVLYAPEDCDRNAVNDVAIRLVAGVVIDLAGYWKPREFNGKKHFEFAAQFVTFDGETFPNRN